MIQRLHWGEIRQERPSAPDTLFTTTGRRLYVIGDIDGGFRPRSNPYDLHTFGKPQEGDPLANRLQGVWAQPVKALNGYTFVIESEGITWPLLDAMCFTQTFADVQFLYSWGGLTGIRTDFVPQDRPVLFTTLTLRNEGTQPVDIKVTFFAHFNLQDAHFTTLADQPNLFETVQVEGEKLVARAQRLPDRWAVAVGGGVQPTEVQIIAGQDGHSVGVLKYADRLEPGEEHEWTIGLNHLLIGMQFDAQGSVPHQRSPAGAIVVQGNAVETPLWVIALWDAYRWTGDRAFLETVYPAAVQGLLDYTLGCLDRDGDGYPFGPGLVEKEDMGAKKLDSAAYTWAALGALEKMACAMGDTRTEARARARRVAIAAGFEAAWWDPAEGTYSMSLNESDNSRRPIPHWAVIVPLEVGLASSEHAATTFHTLQAKYLNQWGLKHTVGDDERVWTLPTATLSRAAYRYGQAGLGFQMLQQLSATLDHGSIGMYHELIPNGLSFLQLWSGATFLRGAVEDLMGVQVRADLPTVRLAPQLPAGWEAAELERLSFGGHIITVRVTLTGLSVAHLSGPAPLTITYRAPDGSERSAVVEAGRCVQL